MSHVTEITETDRKLNLTRHSGDGGSLHIGFAARATRISSWIFLTRD